MVSSIFYAFFHKPIWKGEFQIVLEDKEEKLNFANQALSNVTGQLGIEKNNLKTEVSILKLFSS